MQPFPVLRGARRRPPGLLDDANIGRFTGLLRQYADRAQFIVVTHQKRTMEAADVLYGVTMSGDGVSQLVSRRLPHDEEVAATA